jgi:NAD(P)H-hydrate epimerase
VLSAWKGPIVLDADAITLFEGRIDALTQHLSGRGAILTPHPVEFARLTGVKPQAVLDQRFEVGRAVSSQLGATVLLKGVPTVIFGADGTRLVSATGTPLLATGGSGDVLSGIIGTLFAQLGDATSAAAIGAWIHGRAAERVPTSGDGVRGPSLDEVLTELRDGWSLDGRPSRYPVLAELPAIPPPAR